VYISTGYGSINSSLFRRGIAEDSSCQVCGIEESVDHVIYNCRLYDDLRSQIANLEKLQVSIDRG